VNRLAIACRRKTGTNVSFNGIALDIAEKTSERTGKSYLSINLGALGTLAIYPESDPCGRFSIRASRRRPTGPAPCHAIDASASRRMWRRRSTIRCRRSGATPARAKRFRTPRAALLGYLVHQRDQRLPARPWVPGGFDAAAASAGPSATGRQRFATKFG
jgi:hypothetical protein